jgi:hypothetical protein
VLAVSGLLTHVFVGPFDSKKRNEGIKIVSIKSEPDDFDSSGIDSPGNISGQSDGQFDEQSDGQSDGQSVDNSGQFLDNQTDDEISEIDENDDEAEEYYINELTPNNSIKSDDGSDDGCP